MAEIGILGLRWHFTDDRNLVGDNVTAEDLFLAQICVYFSEVPEFRATDPQFKPRLAA